MARDSHTKVWSAHFARITNPNPFLSQLVSESQASLEALHTSPSLPRAAIVVDRHGTRHSASS
jgi:hypothetical protein